MANKISKSTAYIIDLLCEGEIEGPANSTWNKSTYFNETVVQNDDNSFNFDGTTINGRTGTALDTNSLSDFNTGDLIEAENLVGVELTQAGGSTARSITDNEVDHCLVTFSFPQGLMVAYDSGKQYGLDVAIKITMTATNGAEITLVEETISKQARSEFRQQYKLSNLSSNFDGVNDTWPIVIKCYRTTADRTSSSKATYVDQIKWYSYTEQKEVQLGYRNRVVVGTQLLAEDFGDNIPNRSWNIKGLKIKHPDNYNPTTRIYTGTWGGSFSTAYCTNPAWVVYDLLTNKRYGLGIDEDKVDKWTLYSIGEYCDGNITYKTDVRQADGSYVQTDVVQPRFTFNGVISDREQALVVINHFASVFRGFPMWSAGLVTFAQDSPGTLSRIVSNANVKDGMFNYEGTSKRQRTTAVKVGWNDPENYGKRDIITLEDRDGIIQYGYNPFDFYAVGCNNRNEAILRGKMALYTNINQTEIVNFVGGLEWADALPGDIIGVQDSNYAGESWSGRITASSTTSITIDAPVTIAGGVTYTLYFQTATSNTTYKTLTNSPGSTSILTWSGAITAPTIGYVWAISSTSLAIRKFRIMSVKEIERNEFQVNAYEYDANKYSLVEAGLIVEPPIPTTQPLGELDPPSNITAEAYSWVDGDTGNRKYGIQLEWTASPDPRTQYYELKYSKDDGGYLDLDTVGDTHYDWPDVLDGTYDIKIRAKSLTSVSKWVTYVDFVMSNEVGTIAPPTNLIVKGGGYEWIGPDCTVTWTGVDEGTYDGNTVKKGVVRNYKVEVYDTATMTLKRTYFTASSEENEYMYSYGMNFEDNDGMPIRSITIKVYSVSYIDTLSTALTHAFTNPAPDMSGTLPVVTPRTGYLEITWANLADLDMAFYKVYIDTSNPPTTFIDKIPYPGNRIEYFNVLYGTTYYVKIVPYDGFGIGIASQIPAGKSPLLIPDINVDVELSDSVTITSDATYTGLIRELYNKTFNAGGITIANPSGKYIQYAYGIENYFDRIAIWSANANPQVYVSYSVDGLSWQFLKAETDHTVDASSNLLAASSQADAQTNYLQLAAGFNYAGWPNNLTAKYVRVYFVNTNSTQIYELIPSRILISELAAIESLSAISANIGTITAGVIQSTDYSADLGFKIDVSNKSIYLGGSTTPVMKFWQVGAAKYLDINAAVTFRSGSTGYANISDKPADSSIYNSYNVNPGNSCPFPNFEGTTVYASNQIGGWYQSYVSVKPPSGGLNYSAPWRAIGTNTIWWMENGPIGGAEDSQYSYVYTDYVAVQVGATYCFSVYTGAHRCKVDAYCAWYNSAGTNIGNTPVITNDTVKAGGASLDEYYRHVSIGTAPATTTFARMIIRKFQTKVGQASSYIFTCHPMFSEVGANQTTAPGWSAGGTDNSHWSSPSDITKIDGGKLYVGSQLLLNEGGKATFGNQNVVIDTAGSHGSIIVAPDGGTAGQDYCHLNEGDINFYRYIAGSHRPYTSMTRVESGTAASGTWVPIPGYWKNAPTVMVSPKSIQGFNKAYINYDQSLKVEAGSLYQYATGQWQFQALAYNELANGTISGTHAGQRLFYGYTTTSVTCYFPAGCTRVWWNCKWGAGYNAYEGAVRPANVIVTITYYYNSGSNSVLLENYTMPNLNQEFYKVYSFDSANYSANPYAYNITITPSGNYFAKQICSNFPPESANGGYGLDAYPLDYSAQLSNATITATGTLSWLAVGR